MFSIRMRAAKKTGVRGQGLGVRRKHRGTHISGAEGIYEKKDLQRICHEYIQRALTHPRGKPDEVFITVEKIKQKPKKIPLLKVKTLKCESPQEAEKVIFKMLSDTGISLKAINGALKVLKSGKTMRGASLILMKSGRRVEPDKVRGVRVSRMGIEKKAEKKLSQMLAKDGINTLTVKEALILASKVASSPSVVAEVCISDDPDYTTGYISSRKIGYLRIPNIKKTGEMHGGRVFFVKESADVERLVSYLERVPVLLDFK